MLTGFFWIEGNLEEGVIQLEEVHYELSITARQD